MVETTSFIKSEVWLTISKYLNTRKGYEYLGYDLITGRILKELPELGRNYSIIKCHTKNKLLPTAIEDSSYYYDSKIK
jgi:hypothetical protein